MQNLDQEFVFQQAINITDPTARNEFLERSCAATRNPENESAN